MQRLIVCALLATLCVSMSGCAAVAAQAILLPLAIAQATAELGKIPADVVVKNTQTVVSAGADVTKHAITEAAQTTREQQSATVAGRYRVGADSRAIPAPRRSRDAQPAAAAREPMPVQAAWVEPPTELPIHVLP